MIRVLIVSDVRLYREGLGEMLSRCQHVSVAGAVAHTEEALPLVAVSPPDVVLLDLGVPDGVRMLKAIRQAAPPVQVVALGVADADAAVLACAEAGAAGFVPRDASLADLEAVLQRVVRGEALCSPRTTAALLRRVAALSAGQLTEAAPRLTLREMDTIRLVDRGLSNKEIARQLGVEVATVKNHVHNILEKLKVHRRGEAAARLRSSRLLMNRAMSAGAPRCG